MAQIRSDGRAARREQRAERVSARSQTSRPASGEEQRRSHFLAESWGELKKVEWPGQQQVIQGTAVVIIACVIVGIYLYGADLIFKRVVQNLLLGQ